MDEAGYVDRMRFGCAGGIKLGAWDGAWLDEVGRVDGMQFGCVRRGGMGRALGGWDGVWGSIRQGVSGGRGLAGGMKLVRGWGRVDDGLAAVSGAREWDETRPTG